MGSHPGCHFWRDHPRKNALVSYRFPVDCRKLRYKTIQETPGDLHVNDVTGEKKLLTRVEVTESRETLGICLAPDGNMCGQFAKLHKLAKEWVDMMQAGKLNGKEIWTALKTTIWRTMAYSLPVTTMSRNQWETIMSTLLKFALSAMGICRHFPRDIVFAPVQYIGLGIQHLHVLQEIMRLKDILHHTHNQTNTCKPYLSSFELLHIEIGSTEPLHTLPYSISSNLTLPSLVKVSWEFLDSHCLQLHTSLTIQLPWKKECFVMEKIYAFTSDWQLLQMANKCHLYLSALFLSDISDGSGRYILDDACTGAQRSNEHRHSSWPNQAR
jgi:hypothetical protein